MEHVYIYMCVYMCTCVQVYVREYVCIVCVCMCVLRVGQAGDTGRSIDTKGARKGRIKLIKNHERRYVTRDTTTIIAQKTQRCYACNCIDCDPPSMLQSGPWILSQKTPKSTGSFSPFLFLSVSIEDKSPTRAHGVSRLTFDCVMLALLIDTLHFRQSMIVAATLAFPS